MKMNLYTHMHSLTHSPTHSPTHPLTHSITYSLTHLRARAHTHTHTHKQCPFVSNDSYGSWANDQGKGQRRMWLKQARNLGFHLGFELLQIDAEWTVLLDPEYPTTLARQTFSKFTCIVIYVQNILGH